MPSHEGAAPALQVGDRAPEFALRRTFEESIRLSQLLLRGPAVVHFYVFDYGGI